MREALSLPLATFACSATAAVMATVTAWILGFSHPDDQIDFGITLFFAFAICLPYVMIIGLPIGLFLVHKRMFRPIPVLVSGAISASPIPILFLVSAVVESPYPLREITSSLRFLGLASFAGSLSAIVFYWTYRLISPNNSFKPTPLRGAA